MKNYKLIAYATDFVSFLMQTLEQEINKIDNIYLFGSISRGEADIKSDIDIFIDTDHKDIEKKLENVKNDFYKSYKFKNYWALLGIKNDFSFSIGRLDEWEDLKRSVISNGIILYSKYKERFKGEIYNLFKIESKEKRSENVRFWRKFYGYKQKIGKKTYVTKGLIKDLGGTKLAKSLFAIPLEKTNIIIKELKSNRIRYQIAQIITDIPINFSD
jgi:predicted nucleotidyltransferase